MEKPVVVSDDHGMDFVRDGDFGVTFRYGNERELAVRLDQILEDHELAKEMGQNGKKCVLKNYTWEIITERVEQLYRAAV